MSTLQWLPAAHAPHASAILHLSPVQVEMTNVSILLRPSRLCTPELVEEQVQGFAQLLGSSDRFQVSGTTATVVQLTLPVPVTQTATGTPGECAAGCQRGFYPTTVTQDSSNYGVVWTLLSVMVPWRA